ncbi:helix-turn-helix domain-containing protein [Halomonas sp. SpR1]|uniref:GlxA family transcriptional regulator n=1 Tax=Halomonas sp. SpR1 TaxID=3050462 RepID=UPI0027E4E9A2|nr:helix-turn-helix domain-containing protein [Halomonas sp. SpR1]MDQ7733559.1 helix-turn-helix domain-containing protein [Halomonas sp. SpR1]
MSEEQQTSQLQSARAKTLRIAVLMMPGQVPLDLIGPLQVLQCADRLSIDVQVRYIGPKTAMQWLGPLTLSGIDPLPEQLPPQDLLLIPGQYRNSLEPLAQQECVGWLKANALYADTLMTVCSGTLLLADAGLLEGRRCTTHHALIEQLRLKAPRAKVQSDCIFIEDGRYLTSAGISTGIDTMLYWLTRACGHSLALAVAREMVLYLRRSGQEPQLGAWLEGRNHVDERLHRVQDAICAAPSQTWRIETLAAQAAMSERHFRRQFKSLTGMLVGDYIMGLRLQRAKALMTETTWALARIAEASGFGDERQLRRVWARQEKAPPSVWRQASSQKRPD